MARVRFVKMAQQDFDNLSVKDPNALYFVNGSGDFTHESLDESGTLYLGDKVIGDTGGGTSPSNAIVNNEVALYNGSILVCNGNGREVVQLQPAKDGYFLTLSDGKPIWAMMPKPYVVAYAYNADTSHKAGENADVFTYRSTGKQTIHANIVIMTTTSAQRIPTFTVSLIAPDGAVTTATQISLAQEGQRFYTLPLTAVLQTSGTYTIRVSVSGAGYTVKGRTGDTKYSTMVVMTLP